MKPLAAALLALAAALLVAGCGVTTEDEPEELTGSPTTTSAPPVVTQSPEPATSTPPATFPPAGPSATAETSGSRQVRN